MKMVNLMPKRAYVEKGSNNCFIWILNSKVDFFISFFIVSTYENGWPDNKILQRFSTFKASDAGLSLVERLETNKCQQPKIWLFIILIKSPLLFSDWQSHSNLSLVITTLLTVNIIMQDWRFYSRIQQCRRVCQRSSTVWRRFKKP